jgi:endonuclease YncB( thermonuclease family)
MIKLISFVLLFSSAVYAQDFDNVKLVSVYDGDSITVDLDCDIPLFCDDAKIRIKGIDTPEMRTEDRCEKKKAKEAKAYLEQLLSKGLSLVDCTRGKYYRNVCRVITNQGDAALLLIKRSLAYPYAGGTKQEIDWCRR